jgi:hypothetical protein
MSEFLSRLIARSIRLPAQMDEGKILQPRLPSLFEGMGGPAGPHAPSGGNDVPVEEASEVSSEWRSYGRLPPPAAEEEPLERVRPAGPLDGTEAGGQGFASRLPQAAISGRRAESGVPLPGGADGQIRPSAAESVPASGDQMPPRAAAGGPLRAGESKVPAADETRPARPDVHLRAAAPEEVPPQPGAGGLRGEGGAKALAADGTRPIRPNVRLHVPAPETPSLQPGLVDLSGSRPAVPVEAAGPDRWAGAPTVRINIGRIEVRAVPAAPAPAARPPAPPQPKLTLDEYLRQRNEGKR